MTIKNRPAVRAAAAESLAANPGNPRLVVLIYAAILAASSLAVNILLTLLDKRIAETGGIGGMGLRSILSTVRTVLPLAQTLALLGLEMGYRKSAMGMARRRASVPHDLLEGFSYFGPLLRSMLLQMGVYLLISFVTIQAASVIFLMTPLSADFVELVLPLATDTNAFYNAISGDPELFLQAGKAMLPVIPIWLMLFLALGSPFFYSWRMTHYCILETRGKGALAAMSESAQMMRNHRVDLLKLDLGFWWFWLGQLAVSLVLYGDQILPALGVTLPWSAEVSYYVFYVASLLLQTALYYFFMNRLEITYATAYDTLRPRPRESTGGAVLGNIFELAKDYRDDAL